MIDLHALEVSDSKAIHEGTIGVASDSVDMTFTEPGTSGATQTIKAKYNDTSLLFSIETGLPVTGSKIAISFHQSTLTIWDGKATLKNWKIQFTNGAGQAVTALINDVRPDRSFGDVVCTCELTGDRV